MKVRVILPFKDRHTKIVYSQGQEIEVTIERYEELNSAALGPFVESLEEAPKKKTAAQKKSASNKAKK